MYIMCLNHVHPHPWTLLSPSHAYWYLLPNESAFHMHISKKKLMTQWISFCLLEQRWEFVYRSLGILPVTTLLEKMALPEQPFTAYGDLWGAMKDLLLYGISMSLILYRCEFNHSFCEFKSAITKPCSDVFALCCHHPPSPPSSSYILPTPSTVLLRLREIVIF